MGETSLGRSQQIVNHHLQTCLADLLQAGVVHPDAVVHSSSGWTVLLVVFTSAPPGERSTPQLTECDRHCLILLSRMQRPLSAYKICNELERQGIGIWGIATVKRSLARLKGVGIISNSRKRPRGYFLPEKDSLFLRHLEDDPKV